MQCPRCQQENPTSHKCCRECGTPLAHLEGGAQPAPSYADLQRSLTEALEQQTATSEILRVISSSPSNIQPVFDAIAANAARLCDAVNGLVIRFDGQLLHLAAHHNVDPERLAALRQAYPRPPSRGSLSGRSILTCAVVHVPDVSKDPEYTLPAATTIGYRSVLAVPTMHEGVARGTILVARDVVAPFSDTHIALLQTFADQAVIAIENARLFNETKEALDQQTATSEILRVISSSPTDVQPVFDVIVERAVRLCGARFGRVYRYDGDVIHMVAGYGLGAAGLHEVQRVFPRPASDDTIVGRVILTRQPALIRDIEREERVPALSRRMIEALETRSQVTIPMLRTREPIGAITLGWAEPEAFDEQQIALLQTFADQAVIAVENVRLFKALEARNHDLTEALEQQTATSEVLKVISRSAFDLRPVLETLVENATRLCGAETGLIWRFDGEAFLPAADYGVATELKEFWERNPIRPGRDSVTGRAALERRTVHIPDALADPEYRLAEAQKMGGYRTLLGVPMLREGVLMGVFGLQRYEVRPFTDKQIELVTTFADQAVIAIENVRLFTELQARTAELTQSVEKLTALGEVSQALSSTLDLDTVLTTIVNRAVHLSGANGGQIFEYDEAAEEFRPRASNEVEDVVAATQHTRLRKGEGAVGRMAVTREAVQIPDIAIEGAYESRARAALLRSGRHALLAVPLLSEEHIVGGLVISRNAAGAFPVEVVDLLRTFATQSALAIQNARLFHEIENKSRQLEAASRHKSEFLANMSHELRTPLNAVIGFSEVLIQRMFGELNDKQDEYLKDIYASGQHLLSLINDILDLSKIEAGRMELTPAPFHLPTALDNAVTLVKERAGRHGIALQVEVDPQLAEIVGDERKIKQVLLNLLSNAVKFTPEGGRISLKAGRTDGMVQIAVSDTGIGIAPEDQAAIFEEFRQVGHDETRKQEGTGLGLTLAKKFVELHGGRIWVESEPARGSTFTFTLPVH